MKRCQGPAAIGSCTAASQPLSWGEALSMYSFSTSRKSSSARLTGSPPARASWPPMRRARTGCWPRPRRLSARRRSDFEQRRQRAYDRVEDRIITVQVAADNARAASTTAVADDRKLLPRRGWQERCDWHRRNQFSTAHDVLLTIREDNHVTLTNLEPVARVHGDPTTAFSDDVEQNQPFGTWPEDAGKRCGRRRFIGPGRGVLGAQEYGPGQAYRGQYVSQQIDWRTAWRRVWKIGQLVRCSRHGAAKWRG